MSAAELERLNRILVRHGLRPLKIRDERAPATRKTNKVEQRILRNIGHVTDLH